MKTLILGLGSPILTDDSVGLRVARALEGLKGPEVTVAEDSVTGLDFLDVLVGYERAIIVDAIQTRWGKAGQIYRFEPDALAATRRASTPHDVNLATALELGRQLGLDLPRQIIIFGIEVEDVISFGEDCTPAVAAAIPECVEMIVREVNVAPDMAR